MAPETNIFGGIPEGTTSVISILLLGGISKFYQPQSREICRKTELKQNLELVTGSGKYDQQVPESFSEFLFCQIIRIDVSKNRSQKIITNWHLLRGNRFPKNYL